MSSIKVQRCGRVLRAAWCLRGRAVCADLGPMPDAGGLATGLDKLIHVGMFGALAVLVHWNLIPARAIHRAWAVALAVLTMALTGRA